HRFYRRSTFFCRSTYASGQPSVSGPRSLHSRQGCDPQDRTLPIPLPVSWHACLLPEIDVDFVFLELLLDILELLVTGDGNRPGVALTLQLARRILDEALHHLLQLLPHERARPGGLGEVGHEDVVAFLRIRPEIEDLRNGGDILLSTLPSQVGVHRQASGGCAVVAAQIEHKLELVIANRSG